MDGAPDFIILGAMKAGTTSLFHWLRSHPQVQLSGDKELNFFSDDDRWRRGVASYMRHFANVHAHKVSGEASPQYMFPDRAAVAARRMFEVVPEVKLIAILRDPLSRSRSHYQHQVRRAREKRSFADCLADLGSEYVQVSRYGAALEPYYQTFPHQQILVLPFHRLVAADEQCWQQVLTFLELDPMPRPVEKHNVTANAHQFTPLMRELWERGLVQRLAKLGLPKGVRSLAKRLLLRPVQKAPEEVAPAATADVWEADAQLLRAVLGSDDIPWPQRPERGHG